jgi:DNA-binding NarL/FixJ family response regulator
MDRDPYDFFITFTNTIGSVSASNLYPQIRAASSAANSQSGSIQMAKTVLVVDENVILRRALCQLFTSETEFEICGEAENGQEAIEKAQELRPHIILMDFSMPVMNGLDAARALKKLMPTVPVVMFSEYSDVFADNEGFAAGISGLVSKTDHFSVLLDMMRRSCGLAAA